MGYFPLDGLVSTRIIDKSAKIGVELWLLGGSKTVELSWTKFNCYFILPDKSADSRLQKFNYFDCMVTPFDAEFKSLRHGVLLIANCSTPPAVYLIYQQFPALQSSTFAQRQNQAQSETMNTQNGTSGQSEVKKGPYMAGGYWPGMPGIHGPEIHKGWSVCQLCRLFINHL